MNMSWLDQAMLRKLFQGHNDARYFLLNHLYCCGAIDEIAATPICAIGQFLIFHQDTHRGEPLAQLVRVNYRC